MELRYPNHSSKIDVIHCPISEQRWRVKFGGGHSTRINGYPSKGGTYILDNCSGVELDFLGLDRFDDSKPSQDKGEEEMHVNKMRKLGASWWESEHEYDMHQLKQQTSSQRDPILLVGWPNGGGVWMFRATEIEAVLKGSGRVANAYTMEERCRAIERIGGRFYADPMQCPHLDLAVVPPSPHNTLMF